MKYYIKGTPSTTIVVLDKREDNMSLLITKDFDGYKEQKKELMERAVFDMCVRTGYLQPEEAVAV